MPERRRLTAIPSITGVDLARPRVALLHLGVAERSKEIRGRVGSINQQWFMPNAAETDWQRFVIDHQVIKRPSPLRKKPVEIIVPRAGTDISQRLEVHPDQEKLLIVLQFPGVDIIGEFIPGKKIYGEGNTVFYAPVSFWKEGRIKRTFLIVATWGEKKILESQIARQINRNPLFRPRVSLARLAAYDTELQGVNPDIGKYNLSGMQISGVGNIVIVTYPHTATSSIVPFM